MLIPESKQFERAWYSAHGSWSTEETTSMHKGLLILVLPSTSRTTDILVLITTTLNCKISASTS